MANTSPYKVVTLGVKGLDFTENEINLLVQ